MFRGKFEEKIKTQILCSVTFFRKSYRLRDMWKNIIETDRQTTDGVTGHDTPSDTPSDAHSDTHSEYGIIIVFTEQQWLFECALIFHLYVHCLIPYPLS